MIRAEGVNSAVNGVKAAVIGVFTARIRIGVCTAMIVVLPPQRSTWRPRPPLLRRNFSTNRAKRIGGETNGVKRTGRNVSRRHERGETNGAKRTGQNGIGAKQTGRNVSGRNERGQTNGAKRYRGETNVYPVIPVLLRQAARGIIITYMAFKENWFQ